jgi:hypothetical protein
MTQSAPPPPAPSVWEDLLEIFYAPAQVFARRQEEGFFLALIVFGTLITAIYFATRGVMQPIFDAEFHRGIAAAMKRDPRITPENAEQFRGTAAVFGGLIVIAYGFLGPLFTGLVLWLAGKLVEAKEEAGTAIMVAVYSLYPRVLEAVINTLQVLVLPEDRLKGINSIKLGVSRFLDPDATSPVILALLSRVDLFTLWVTALLAIGLSVTGRVSRAQAAVAAAAVWVVGALPTVLGALRQG